MVRINEVQLHNIQLMLEKGFNREEIASIIGCGITTVRRVENGTHSLLQQNTSESIVDVKSETKVEEKLDIIIDLLKEVISLWK